MKQKAPLLVSLVGLFVLSLFFVSATCTPPPACSSSQPCAAGLVCQEGQCVPVSSEESNEPPSEKGVEAHPEDGGEPPGENKPEQPPEQKAPTIYRWRKVSPPSGANLNAVALPTAKQAWVVGSGGAIYHSSDGGKKWSAQKSGTTAELRSVSFVDPTHGWVVGDKGTLLRTTDGGKTWEKLTAPVKENILGVQFIQRQVGFLVGEGATFHQSKSAGERWQAFSFAMQINLHAVHFHDLKVGHAIGSQGTILVTETGGLRLTTSVTGTNKTFYALHFFQDQGWVVGEGGIIRYRVNRSRGWTPLASGVSVDLHGVWFLDAKRGWIVGDSGIFRETTDGGENWRSVAPGPLPDLRGIAAVSAQAGLAVGKNGTILRITALQGECQSGQQRPCYEGPAGTKGVGLCQGGTQTCHDGEWSACQGQKTPAAREICFNEQDDNCNGKTDKEDGCPDCQNGSTRSCYTGPQGTLGTGACRAGTQTCQKEKWGPCEKEILPRQEQCNKIDDDCDGKIDNNLAQPPPCPKVHGVCSGTHKVCKDGRWQDCTSTQYGADYEKKETRCEGKDNDCDGSVDEDCPCTAENKTRPCYTAPPATKGVGLCKEGQQTCSGGKWSVCQKEVKPSLERCADKLDNDCDGKTDETSQFALSFSGRRAYVQITDDKSLAPENGITVEGWFWIHTHGRSRQRLITRTCKGGYTLTIDGWQKRFYFALWTAGKKDYVLLAHNHTALPTQKWFHLAGTYDGTHLRLWLNGKKIEEEATSGKIVYPQGCTLLFGANSGEKGPDNRPDYFAGKIAAVRLSSSALYDKKFQPECALSKKSNTLGLWNLDEGRGDQLHDDAGKQKGTRHGASWIEDVRCPGFVGAGGCQTLP